MSFAFIEKTVNSLVESNVIVEDDKEIVEYGIEQGLLILLNILTTVTIGFVFDMVLESLIYLVAFIPLRSYVGGYHARTKINCYISSVVIISIVLASIKYVNWSTSTAIILTILSGIIIFICAPRADVNKPFDEIELIVFRKRAHIICSIELLLIFIFFNLGYKTISLCILMGLISCVAMLYMDMLKHLLVKKD
jgi:accessory gene regulator B